MRDRVVLSAANFVAEGTDRECFRHPEQTRYCIKVLKPERHARRFRREIRYYRRLEARNIDWLRLSRYRATVATNLGRGAVFELVLDADGSVSKSLEYYLAAADAAFSAWAGDELNALTRDLYRQWIVFHDLNPGNLLLQKNGDGGRRLVAIDGIGHNHFLPLASYSAAYARRKIRRVWNRRYPQWYAPYPELCRRLQRLPKM